MTLRSKVILPVPMPSSVANRTPARPASASPTRSRTRLGREVNRWYGAASLNGSANVRRGQPAAPQMNRRTVSLITTFRSPRGRSFNLR